ncbi:MAG: molybdopterin-synthase adenylyltransferase MoeB [Flavobacteriales bacterium]
MNAPNSSDFQKRYDRQIRLDQIGLKGQQKLAQSRVLIIGMGGLGCPVAQYLAAAGVGHLTLVDFDCIELSNLQRQVLFNTSMLGTNKAKAAREVLQKLNPEIEIQSVESSLDARLALDLFSDVDVVVDGTDNFSTRYLVNDACLLLGKPLVSASVVGFSGQLSVFNYKNGPTYRCLFPQAPEPEFAPNCNELGVLGVLPGILGSLQANEVLKICLDLGGVLSGKLLIFDALQSSFQSLNFAKHPNSNLVQTKDDLLRFDYQYFCANESEIAENQQLLSLKECPENALLLDLRQLEEQPRLPLSDRLIVLPLSELEAKAKLLPKSEPMVCICQTGARSAKGFHILKKLGFSKLLNLKNGLQNA